MRASMITLLSLFSSTAIAGGGRSLSLDTTATAATTAAARTLTTAVTVPAGGSVIATVSVDTASELVALTSAEDSVTATIVQDEDDLGETAASVRAGEISIVLQSHDREEAEVTLSTWIAPVAIGLLHQLSDEDGDDAWMTWAEHRQHRCGPERARRRS